MSHKFATVEQSRCFPNGFSAFVAITSFRRFIRGLCETKQQLSSQVLSNTDMQNFPNGNTNILTLFKAALAFFRQQNQFPSEILSLLCKRGWLKKSLFSRFCSEIDSGLRVWQLWNDYLMKDLGIFRNFGYFQNYK